LKPIYVHVVLDKGTLPYAQRMLRVAREQASDPGFTACTWQAGSRGSSWGHGEGLQQAFTSVATKPPGIHVIADSDTVLLKRNWDVDIRKQLEDVHCFGAAYDRIGSFSAGDGPSQTYKTCPNLTWLAFDSASAPWHLFDPQRAETELELSPTLEQLYGLRPGDRLLRDVGWQLPMFLYVHQLKSRCLDRKREVLRSLPEYHEEWHLGTDPFLAHQRGSSKHPFMSDPHSRPFYMACDRWLER
jgi:hypothetical protein